MLENFLPNFLHKQLQIGTLVYFNFQTENDAKSTYVRHGYSAAGHPYSDKHCL
jgi:hypothetical protein